MTDPRASAAQLWALEVIHAYAGRSIPIYATPEDAPTAYIYARTWAVLVRHGWVEFHGEPNQWGHRAVRLTDAGHAQLPAEETA